MIDAGPCAHGSFAGDITGGNARGGSAAQTFTYAFDVPSGRRDLDVGVALASDPHYLLGGVLVDPHDETQAIDSNLSSADSFTLGPQGLNMQLTTAHPIPGRWRLVMNVVNPVPGTASTRSTRASTRPRTSSWSLYSGRSPSSSRPTLRRRIDVVGDLTAAQGGSTVSVAKVKENPGTVSTGLWFTDVNEVGAVDSAGAPTADSTVNPRRARRASTRASRPRPATSGRSPSTPTPTSATR